MIHIDQQRIKNLLKENRANSCLLDKIIIKAKSLKRLTLEESAVLLNVSSAADLKKLYAAASFVKDAIYGRRVVLFTPLYISNRCSNVCLYCAFKFDNKAIARKALNIDEIIKETEWLLQRGHKRILMVCGEEFAGGKNNIDYYVEAVKAIYAARAGKNIIKRVNVNCAPLSVDDFKKLKKSGIGTYQVFQETYHQETYFKMHPKGPKSDPDNRIDAVDRAFTAGIDDIGIGALYGLYDYKFETLGLLSHVEHMEKKFKVGPHTISVPRVEPAEGVELSFNPPYKINDEEFKKIVAVLRLSVPYTGIILSTRENAKLRDELLSLGVSQISAESNTSPGGYCLEENKAEKTGAQFSLGDHRTLDQIIGALIDYDYIPSFCAACYRKERTGEAFMQLARPGTIKSKCSMNALITFKEYLDDFASEPVKIAGYRMIERYFKKLESKDQEMLRILFEHVDKGLRDEYV